MRRSPSLHAIDPRCLTILGCFILVPWLGTSCASQSPREPVGQAVSQKTQSNLARARTDLVRAVTAFGIDYDQQICQTRKRRARAKKVRMAISEAYIELTRGVEQAKRRAKRQGRARSSRDLSKTTEDSIVWMTTQPEGRSPPHQSSGVMEWSCLELSEHKSCVQAAAGDVVESFYRAHVPDSDMRMNTLIDLLSVVSEDFEWGLGVIGNEPSLNQARESIRKRCNSGESPIDNFLRQQSSESEAVRITSLDTFRSRLVHEDRELCETLPIMYSNLVDLLRTRLEQRLIEGDCTPDNR